MTTNQPTPEPTPASDPRCDCDSHMDPANGYHYGDCPAYLADEWLKEMDRERD